MNLLENAVKYTPPGSPLEIEARSDGECVDLDVLDHGPGVRAGEETRIFEKFYRGSQNSAPGAGLGLAICKGIVEAHGGTIRAETRSCGGAAFRLSIPHGGPPPSVLAGGP